MKRIVCSLIGSFFGMLLFFIWRMVLNYHATPSNFALIAIFLLLFAGNYMLVRRYLDI